MEGLDDVDVIIEGGGCFEKYGRSRIDDGGANRMCGQRENKESQ